MVIRMATRGLRRCERGSLTMELVLAMGLLTAVMIPLGSSIFYEQKLCRAYYFQAIAMEIIDGEMEVLKAGEWRAFQEGSQPYAVSAVAAKNLPKGKFVLTVNLPVLRLEWVPEKKGKGGKTWREVELAPVKREE
jgi:hypothetical protein